jgi:hypothetical protein
MKLFLFVVIYSVPIWANDLSSSCFRFRVHLKADLPEVVNISSKLNLSQSLTTKISQWENDLDFLKDKLKKESWIKCVHHYLQIDSDHDGINDWTAIVDGLPSRILFPLDEDIDGDGIVNLWDPDPYHKNHLSQALIPTHLAFKSRERVLQNKLHKKHGIIAVNHSDNHHKDVLKIFLFISGKYPFINMFKTSFPKVLYAMKGRHPKGLVASYHPTASAIAVPGKNSFGKNLNPSEVCNLTAALVHELAHFYLFSSVPPEVLKKFANTYALWDIPENIPLDIWDKAFHVPFNGKSHFVSDYAATNVHEWFAENFAAYVWKKNHFNKKFCRKFDESKIPKELFNWFEKVLK